MSQDDRVAAADQAARGRKLLLAVLFVFCGISVVTGSVQILTGSQPAHVPLIRLGLTVLLAYFVYRGALAARVIFAILSVGGALIALYSAITLALPNQDFRGAGTFIGLAGFYLLAAWALWSPPILAFWNSSQPTIPDRDA